MQAELVEQARKIGVAMGSKHGGTIFGWTTDEAKATACSEAGLGITPGYNSVGPVGWEIRAPADPLPEGVTALRREDTEATRERGH
jgi:hypothetical protein